MNFWDINGYVLDINEHHGARAAKVVEQSISLIVTGETDRFEPLLVLQVFPKLMNTMLLDVLSERIHASDNALCGYLCFHRWLLYFAEKYPILLEHVNNVVNHFLEDDSKRHKSSVPSLGEFLPLLSLSDLTWDEVMSSYLTENLSRNVFWVLRKCPTFLTDGTHFNNGTLTPKATQRFFDLVILGKHLAVFHVYFLKNIGREGGASLSTIAAQYDDTFGLSSHKKSLALRQFCQEISSIDTWDKFFESIGKEPPTAKELSDMLLQAIADSLRKKYHEESAEKSQKKCWKFRKQGYCMYGSQCKFAHIAR